MCDPPRIYPSLPEYIPLLNKYIIMRRSHNLPRPPKIYPPFQQLCATLPESTPPSQNIPPFSTNILLCDAPKIYPPSQNIPPFLTHLYVRPSQNLPLPPKIYPLFQQLYATLSESTPPSQNIPPFQQL